MSENGVMDRPRRTTRSSLASSNSGTPQTPSSSSNPYKKPTYFSNSRGGGGETPSRNGTPGGRGRRGRGRPPGSGSRGSYSARGGHQQHQHHVKPECIAVRVDGRRSTGGSTASSGGGRRGGAATGSRRSTYNSRHDYEYHYGSDFESDQNDSEPEEDDLESDADSDADSGSIVEKEENAESDSDFSVSSTKASSSRMPSPPVPIWLDPEKVPETTLELPNSSEDLLLSREHVVKAVEIYEPIRRFHQLVRLSPFRFEDFCGALANEDQSALLAEIHIQLLKSVIREEEANGTLFGPTEVKDSVQAIVYFVDHITWPESLRSYLESDPSWKEVHDALLSVEYPFCGPAVRIKILGWLVDQFLTTSLVREQLLGDGTILHEDHCRACNRLGELICCESCPAVYHLQCITPPLKDLDDPPDDWKCPLCAKHEIAGVNDCTSEVERMGLLIRHERLGYDRHGRKYWFLVRRILVESEDGSEVWYYSTRRHVDELVEKLDAVNYEATLVANLKSIEEELYRQMEVTEEVTRIQNVQRRKTYLEVENGEKEDAEQERVTRLKATGLYKLGQEGLFRTYINHFSFDPSSMSKAKHNEERDRKRHMSHKFSLTTASECKWGIKDLIGCPRTTQIAALRGALTHMEAVLPTTLMHINWLLLRKSWLSLIQNGASAEDFSKAMIMISSCIRNALYNPIWAESTGNVRLIRTTLLEREDRKKAEKREKKDKDDEEDRLKLLPQFVKYTLPIKHQVYKQKGEEYRIHGRWGWIWLSNMRRCKSQDCREIGLLAGPHKHVIQVKNEMGKVKTMLIDPGVYSKLMAKRNLATTVKQPSPVSAEVAATTAPTKDEGEAHDDHTPTPTANGIDEEKEAGESSTKTAADEEVNAKGEQQQPPSERKESSDDVKVEGDNKEQEETNKENEQTEEVTVTSEQPNEPETKKDEPGQLEPKVEPMEVDNNVEEQEQRKNGDVQMEDESSTEENKVPAATQESTEKNEKEESMEVEPTSSKPVETEAKVEEASKETESEPASKEPKENGDIETQDSVVTENESKMEEDVAIEKEKEGIPAESTVAPESAGTTDKSENSVAPSAGPAALPQDVSKQTDDSQTRKFKTDLVNVSSGLASAHRVLYPKIAKRRDYLDNLLQRRITLMSLEEKELRCDYTEEMVVKAKPGLAAFTEEEKKLEQEAEEFPGEEVLDDNLTLAGAYTFKCYSSECRKEAELFTKSKGKNRERLYEKHCYSPMCRLKFCLQETTRFKYERLREIEKEKYINVYKEIEGKREYTREGTTHKVYMKKLPETLGYEASAGIAAHTKKKKASQPAVKYPQTSSFQYATSRKPSILMLPQFELKRLARSAGRSFTPSGFFPNQKSGSWGWPYPCGRPVFRTAWQFRTSHAHTLAAAAMQLRILYASIRWDDILAKIPNTEGKHQVQTDTEIITTEILDHRVVGRFSERVQYLRKMMVVPIDAPKTIREITPSRIGLRKRKRAESPDKTEPVVSEDWVDEEKLELWEIRYYGDRLDRKHDRRSESNTPSTRTKSGITLKQPEKYDPSHNPTPSSSSSSSVSSSSSTSGEKKMGESSPDAVDKTIDSVIQNSNKMMAAEKERGNKTLSPVKTAELMRETLETEMKMQRAVHLSKRDNHAKQNNSNSAASKNSAPPQPTASQQLLQQNAKAGLPTNPRNLAQVAVSTPTSSKVGAAVVGKKFFVNKQNTAAASGIGAQESQTSAGILSRKPMQSGVTISKGVGGTISVVKNPIPQQPATAPITNAQVAPTNISSQPVVAQIQTLGQPQKVSLVRLADGRLQVKGLLPGQNCYQTSDGKIHVTVPTSQVSQVQASANRIQTTAPIPVTMPTNNPATAQPQQQTVFVQGGTAIAVTTSTASQPMQTTTPATTSTIVVTSSTGGLSTIQAHQTTPHVVSSQPLINISNPAMKTAISNISTNTQALSVNKTVQQQQPQQIIVQQQGGQQLIIQGTQALLQHQQKLQRVVQTSTAQSAAQVVKQMTASAANVNKSPTVGVIASGSPAMTTTTQTSNAGIQFPGRIVIQDGKAVYISPGTTTTQQQIAEQLLQHRKVIVNKQMIQTTGSPGQQTIVRPQVIQTSAQGQILQGQQMQIIQGVGGQQLHMITQQTQGGQQILIQQQQTKPQDTTATTGVKTVASPLETSAGTTTMSATTPKATVAVAQSSLATTTAVKHVLPDGRTVLLSPQQYNEISVGGGRKMLVNKPVMVSSTNSIRPQQQIIQTSAGSMTLATGQPSIQIVQGPGGQQFLIQQPASTILQQQQQQVQIVVPSGQLGGQPLLVKKFVKTVGATSGANIISPQNKTVNAGAVGSSVVQLGATAQNQLTQLLGANKALVRLDNNQLAAIQLPVSAANTPAVSKAPQSPTVSSAQLQQQQTTTITRTPGLPISIVSPSKSKVQQQQKSGTIQVISSVSGSTSFSSPISTSTSSITQVSSPITQVPTTPTKILTTPTTVVRLGTPTILTQAIPGVRQALTAPTTSLNTRPMTPVTLQRPPTMLATPTLSPLKQQTIIAVSNPVISGTGVITQAKAPSPMVTGTPPQQQTISHPKVTEVASPIKNQTIVTASALATPEPAKVIATNTPALNQQKVITQMSPRKTSATTLTTPSMPTSLPFAAASSTTAPPPTMSVATPPPPTSTPPATPTKAVKSTPSKIVAQIFQTPQGPKVVIQGVSPGELTPGQMMQLQAQIQKQLAAQQQQQAQKTPVPAKPTSADVPKAAAVVQPPPAAPPVVIKGKGSSPVQAVQAPAVVQSQPHLQSPPPLNMQSAGLQQASPQRPIPPPLLARSPPLVSPAKVLTPPPNPPTLMSPSHPSTSNKSVVGKLDMVAAVSSVTEPALMPPASSNSLHMGVKGNQTAMKTNAIPPGVVLAKKSSPRKSPLKNIIDSSSNSFTSPMSNSNNAISPTSISNRNSSELLSPEQNQLLTDRRNALREDIMEKKKAAATQMKLEAQREIQEKLERSKHAELALATAEEPKRATMQSPPEAVHDPGRGAKKRKSKEMENVEGGRNSADSTPASRRQPKGSKRKRKLFCVCKTPYDKEKFYVGCEKCENWFHGDCVGVTEEMSKDLSEYICDDCQEDKLYCLCRKPYNESQFYIQCDKCEEWFHGRCVGVVQGESDTIGDYSCPTCEPNSEINFPNSKRLDHVDYNSINRLVREIFQHRASAPFRKPVTKAQAPNYFSIIKEPMDLQTLSVRVEEKQYERLLDFIGDVTKIFENCRYFNEPNTDIYRSADNLEKFFVQKIWALRQSFNTRLHQVIP